MYRMSKGIPRMAETRSVWVRSQNEQDMTSFHKMPSFMKRDMKSFKKPLLKEKNV